MIPNGQQIVYLTDRFGHAIGYNPEYFLRVPVQAVGANLIYWDLFNGSTSKLVRVRRIEPFVKTDVAVTGLVGINLILARTSAVGTGGTAAVEGSATVTVCSINRPDQRDPLLSVLDSGITARLTPSGGATLGAILGETSLQPEETNGSAYSEKDMCPRAGIIIPASTGIRVYQGAVASVNSVGFNVEFEVVNLGL